MADFAGFAKRMRAREKEFDRGVESSLVRAVIAVNQAVIVATPVDTGRARANWQVGINQSENEATDETDKSGQSTIARNQGRILGAGRRATTIHLTNNLPYIVALNEGSSAQAPSKFVERAVKAGLKTVRDIRIFR